MALDTNRRRRRSVNSFRIKVKKGILKKFKKRRSKKITKNKKIKWDKTLVRYY